MTGLEVTEVNITVRDVYFPGSEDDSDTEQSEPRVSRDLGRAVRQAGWSFSNDSDVGLLERQTKAFSIPGGVDGIGHYRNAEFDQVGELRR